MFKWLLVFSGYRLQFRDASTYWNSVGTALNRSEMPVLIGGQ